MILFVDETENEEFFIVTGLLVNSRKDINLAYKHFKKKIKDMPVPQKERTILFTEFKSVILDRRYKRIKTRMLEELMTLDHWVIYSCYIKKGTYFSQEFKEDTYVTLLSKIVSSIDNNISVIFDSFNKPDFETRIIDRISSYQTVQAIMPRDSQKEAGLQFVDNLCSVIRLHKSGTDEYSFYSLVEQRIKEV